MRPKSIILLVLALGCGLVASVGINQVMANRRSGPAEPQATTPIFVALAEIGVGDPLTPAVLKIEEWPKEKVPPGALGKLEEVEGRRSRSKFYVGEPILEAKLLGKGQTGEGATDLIPNGFRVVSVRVDAVSSGGGLILPGDRVDVLVHIPENAQRGIPQSSTRTFLQKIKVFAVDDLFVRDKEDETAVAAKTISLLVTPKQAELVTLAAELGTIRLSMRSANDDSMDDTAGATAQELMNQVVADVPAAAPIASNPDLLQLLNTTPTAPAPAPTAAKVIPKAPVWTMVLIEAGNTREVTFADENGLPQSSNDAPAHEPVDEAPSTQDEATDDATTDEPNADDGVEPGDEHEAPTGDDQPSSDGQADEGNDEE